MVGPLRLSKSEQSTKINNRSDNSQHGPGFDDHLDRARKEVQDRRKNRSGTDDASEAIPFSPGHFMFERETVIRVLPREEEVGVSALATESPDKDDIVDNNEKKTSEQGSGEYPAGKEVLARLASEMGLPGHYFEPFVPEFVVVVPSNTVVDPRILAREMADKLEQTGKSFDTIKLSLSPRELGNINLTIKIVDGKVNISIAVDSEQKHLFLKNIDQLAKELEKHNIAIGELSVSVNKDSNSSGQEALWGGIKSDAQDGAPVLPGIQTNSSISTVRITDRLIDHIT